MFQMSWKIEKRFQEQYKNLKSKSSKELIELHRNMPYNRGKAKHPESKPDEFLIVELLVAEFDISRKRVIAWLNENGD